MFVDQLLVAQTDLPIGFLLAKSLDGFLTKDKVCHVKVEGIEYVIVSNATLNDVKGVVWLFLATCYYVIEPIAVILFKFVMSIAFAVVIQFKCIEESRSLFLEETFSILLCLTSVRCCVETFAKVKVGA